MDLARTTRHLLTTRRRTARCLTAADLAVIDKAIAESTTHEAHIHFAIESALHPVELWRGVMPRDRAVELFSELRVWDTENNSGVLIYVLLADRAIEILADRGVHAHVGAQRWELIVDAMRSAFATGRYQEGVLDAIAAVKRELAGFPTSAGVRKEQAEPVPRTLKHDRG